MALQPSQLRNQIIQFDYKLAKKDAIYCLCRLLCLRPVQRPIGCDTHRWRRNRQSLYSTSFLWYSGRNEDLGAPSISPCSFFVKRGRIAGGRISFKASGQSPVV